MGIHSPLRLALASLAALLLFAQPTPSPAGTCSGADPAVVSVVVKGVQSGGGINTYTLTSKVVNLGSAAQAANTLQFVDIYKGSTKKDSRAVPPLKAGESFTFNYVATRSAQAGSGTTALSFQMDVRSPRGSQDCSTGNGTTMVRF
jgi:hypothetical protein